MPTLLSLPVEILIQIFGYFEPPRVLIGDTAAWSHPRTLENWWDKGHSASEQAQNEVFLSEILNGLNIRDSILPYSDLFSLRQVSRDFEELCRALLYGEMNLITMDSIEESILIEVITRYHRYIRLVRMAPDFADAHKEVHSLILLHLNEGATSLGVYYQNTTDEWPDFNKDMIKSLDSGRVLSLGVYSSTCFSASIRDTAPEAATALLKSIVQSSSLLDRFTSMDIVLDHIDEDVYDGLRSRIGGLQSLTIRGALRRTLGQVWDIEQQSKWYTGRNLTNLQLIHCYSAYAPHIPQILQFFPALRNLYTAGCGDGSDVVPPARNKGWSFRNDAPWGKQAPLESVRLEYVTSWEVVAMGSIHTKNLIITAVVGGSVEGSFMMDEEIYPALQYLRTEAKYKELPPAPVEGETQDQESAENPPTSPLQRICSNRGIVISYNVEALVFPR